MPFSSAPTSSTIPDVPPHVKPALQPLLSAWTHSDTLFQNKPFPEVFSVSPISLRNPFLFYLGHLPSFALITLRKYIPTLPSPNLHFDDLFSRGIDPDVDDPSKCHTHPQRPSQWPTVQSIFTYLHAARTLIVNTVQDLHPLSQTLLNVITLIAEHEYMHVETLHYMLAQHRRVMPSPCSTRSKLIRKATPPPVELLQSIQWISIPAGKASPGYDLSQKTFVWDNERDISSHHVPAFRILKFPISIKQYQHFIDAGGYNDISLWNKPDWEWLQKESINYPQTWERHPNSDHTFTYLTNGSDASPVSVSLAEATAFANWLHSRIMTELQWVRAVGGIELQSGYTPAESSHKPKDVHDGDVSDHGVVGLRENGWELTSTVFDKFENFKPDKAYPEYSQDFFDGKHFVLRGSSWVTQPVMKRFSFRNFYQVRYPYVFSKFRLVSDCPEEE